MEEEELTITDYISYACAASSILLYLTGWPMLRTVLKYKNTGDISTFPYIAMFTNCSIWVGYGQLAANPVLKFLNSVGVVLQLLYITIFYYYSKSKRLFNQQLMYSILFVGAIYTYVYVTEDKTQVINILGSIGSVLAVLAYAAPLSAMGEVISTRSTASMNFALSLANFLVGLEWTLYGTFLKDIYIMGPNLLGTFVSIAQLSLFWFYPSKPSPTVLSA